MAEPTMRQIVTDIYATLRADKNDAEGTAFLRSILKPALFAGTLYAIYLVLSRF